MAWTKMLITKVVMIHPVVKLFSGFMQRKDQIGYCPFFGAVTGPRFWLGLCIPDCGNVKNHNPGNLVSA